MKCFFCVLILSCVTMLSSRADAEQSPDLADGHWAYMTLAELCSSPDLQAAHPFYNRGMLRNFTLTRYEIAIAIVKIKQIQNELRHQHKSFRTAPNFQFTEREAEDALFALQIEFAPEIKRLT